MLMSPGSASRDELIGGLERGLLVTRFHYTNPVHPKKVVVTGMTRDGTFLVEGGRIVGPVRNLRFTQSYLDALAGVEAVGSERKVLKASWGRASCRRSGSTLVIHGRDGALTAPTCRSSRATRSSR